MQILKNIWFISVRDDILNDKTVPAENWLGSNDLEVPKLAFLLK